MMPTYLPSPPQGVWNPGPVPIRAYALCILLGILVAVWWTKRRWVARGGAPDDVLDVVMWAVPFGIVGGRLYHVITDPELYFVAGKQPIRALYIWDGGMGIWGAVALGAVGAWIGCRRRGIRLADFADAVAPGLVLAQAIRRWRPDRSLTCRSARSCVNVPGRLGFASRPAHGGSRSPPCA